MINLSSKLEVSKKIRKATQKCRNWVVLGG